VAWTDGKV
jgi:galactitol-specific phosphotransferase system IIB component